jgi:hypothetical protein
LTFPGPAPCATLLQTCIDNASAGDLIEIRTNGPINESPEIDKSLTLRAAAGYAPRLAALNSLLIFPDGSADHTISVDGLVLETGRIIAGHTGPGQLDLKILNNVIERSFSNGIPAIELRTGTQGDPRGFIHFEIADNSITVPSPFSNQQAGISVGLSLARKPVAPSPAIASSWRTIPPTSGGPSSWRGVATSWWST